MNKEDMSSLLDAIANRVTGYDKPFNSGTAPVKLTIGYVNEAGMCFQDGIVIISAPQAITGIVMDWVETTNEDDTKDRPVILVEPGSGGLIIR